MSSLDLNNKIINIVKILKIWIAEVQKYLEKQKKDLWKS